MIMSTTTAAAPGTFRVVIVAIVSSTLRPLGALAASVGHDRFLRLFRPLLELFALGGFRHIDAPARQLGCQPGVLPIFPNGERQLFLVHRHDRRMIGFAQLRLKRLHRAERVRDEGRLVRTPLDDVNFFVVQFAYDIVDARPAHPHARTNRIEALLAGDNGNLRAAPWLARNGLDLYSAVVDLWNFGFEQAPQQMAMCARDEEL